MKKQHKKQLLQVLAVFQLFYLDQYILLAIGLWFLWIFFVTASVSYQR